MPTNVYEKVRLIDKNKCRAWGCRKRNGDIEVHHIIPRSQGGPNKEWNLICLCYFHHELITSKKLTDIELLTKIKRCGDFRWLRALEWHINRKALKNL